MYENKPFHLGKMRDIDPHLIDVSVLSANPKFACTGEGIMAKRKKSKNRMQMTEFSARLG